MNLSENTTEAPSAVVDWPARTQPIAPWWHTAILVIIILGVSTLSTIKSKTGGLAGHHIERYAITIAWEWVLALIAWWGIRIRRTPIREVLGTRRSGVREWFRDFGIALAFWIVAMMILAAIGLVLYFTHVSHAKKTVLNLGPATFVQVLVWILLCCTAGIVEEFVFRGYLLQQFSSISGNVLIGVIASSLLFGAAHGYEGIGAMITIAVYGALFCMLAIRRRSLRAGMIAHAWHDSITGIFIAIVKHLHLV
ncbi:MAG TPA: type II CAAX endopeptidase family protein [Acidobacteriaceae bacterium]|nr:type II CAAX endopeptidase family protein [Acidobacteriaceae bacterium]